MKLAQTLKRDILSSQTYKQGFIFKSSHRAAALKNENISFVSKLCQITPILNDIKPHLTVK